ncbi:hypothetical protein T4B_1899 [Trichinella pseudospiralis]|uniref:Uncharacterized protein n=2 Tax=Trichinella pseudospiralis TaxID=6337 RepID=A0A0V1GHQ9_TRIPS|nr:hypothetical protein T4A_498 [Trichinella pseudospiralis]KRY80720.1 hypothetical protein T4D_780 [Trichinella pseudospiralis]KRY97672.1 hypothetical protein T4B_9123 [Trichinella pseudospiralis]KRY97780.1 hypothetical protein T4B_1899 [Trichinella pseudospiralis]KRZ00289.1 hypothetical protein T4C_9471 [Trichinella pseudospiralis]
MKNTKSENADDTKQIADGTKQNKKRTRVWAWDTSKG